MDTFTGIYLHIPFCRGDKCPYCDFYSLPFREETAGAYTDALLRAMELQPFYLPKADTLYLGGGTPSLLGAARLDRLLQKAVKTFSLDAGAEITLEANPDSVTPGLLADLRAMGFNRISFGVQSGADAELAALGRSHTAAGAKEAVLTAYRAGFTNISADLILGVPGQTADSLAESIAFLTALPVAHISAYLLKIEEGTPFSQREEALSLPGEELEADFYLACVRLLEEAGFARYEISNFAREGMACRHNLNYWRCGQYLGLGPAAHSFLLHGSHPVLAGRDAPPPGSLGRRYSFPRDLQAFIKTHNPFLLPQDEGLGGGAGEQLMLRLRLTEGFDTGLLTGYGLESGLLLSKAKELAAHGLCLVKDGAISLTPQGCLLSNSVIASLMQAIEET